MSTLEQDVTKKTKYLTLRVADEHYGVEALRVREIIGMLEITPLPRVPEYVRGVINLRGRIIPVIDLRLRLGMEGIDYNPRTCIVVLDLQTKDEDVSVAVGCIVDAVSEVREVNPDEIAPPSTLGSGERAEYIQGLAKIPEYDMVVSLLDIDNLLHVDLS